MVQITELAKQAVVSYAAAISLAASPSNSSDLSNAAAAMSTFYLPNVTAFTLGSITRIPDQDSFKQGTEFTLAKYNASGIGTDFRLERYKIDPIGETSAIAWVTYRMVLPGSGGVRKGKGMSNGGWEFTNVYGFRVLPGGRQGWEWANADGEYTELLKSHTRQYLWDQSVSVSEALCKRSGCKAHRPRPTSFRTTGEHIELKMPRTLNMSAGTEQAADFGERESGGVRNGQGQVGWGEEKRQQIA
ncbi:hypothetical protein B0T21DRAFT_353585 [Apiosordaria backusii]|uniref:Uncharacterized protein n=1 Tax=Apiosordaria backusii TaxID=314023 RepID=A0AA39ZRS2_9PEZI|nr:hypothetical protein B0T21DRAFT_353585 [Apiosordaria backusii]